MDLDQLDTKKFASQGFPLRLKHPIGGEDLGVVINVMGADSDAYQAEANAQAQRRLGKTTRKNRFDPATPEEIKAESVRLLAAITIGWSGVERKGAAVEFSRDAAAQLYTDFPWIFEQVDAAIHDRANFLPGSATA